MLRAITHTEVQRISTAISLSLPPPPLSLSLSFPLSAVLSHSCSPVPPLWWGLSCRCWGLQRWSGCPQQSQDHIITGTPATPGNGQTHTHNIDIDIHLTYMYRVKINVSGLAYVQCKINGGLQFIQIEHHRPFHSDLNSSQTTYTWTVQILCSIHARLYW